MLLRDLLVALPGLVGPVGTPSRVQDIEIKLSQIVSPVASTASGTIVSNVRTPSAPAKDVAVDQQETGSRAPAGASGQEEVNNGTDPVKDRADLPQDSTTPSVTPPKPPVLDDEADPLPSETAISLDSGQATVMAGRVATLLPADDQDQIASVRILEGADWGHVSVNPDNSLALVLSEDPRNNADIEFRYEITYADGQTENVLAKVDVLPGQEPEGWGLGDFYMLETGADGQVVVEHGENHRKVHVTEGAHGLTAAEIARIEGISTSEVTAKWLVQNPEYGATPDKALDAELGMELWYAVTGRGVDPNSNWLLFERGYEYEDLGRIVSRGTVGESALNPTFIGAYGEGADPAIKGVVNIYQDKAINVVIQGIDLTGLSLLGGENILFDRISVTGNQATIKDTLRMTIRDSDITDSARDEPVTKDWAHSANRTSGVYISGVDGAYVDNNLFDRNGWKEGYDYNMTVSKPMPPSMFNHNLYVQYTVSDITVRDNIFLRGASFGAQVRPGGVIEGNSFIDNNAALNFFAGHNYTLALDNLVTSGGFKKVAHYQGALGWGIDGFGKQTSLIGNILTHLADPNNAAENAAKANSQKGLAVNENNYYDDTIIYNWSKESKKDATNADRNLSGLSQSVLDQTTIQNFTAQLLGKETATISDLANHLRAQADGKLDHIVDADVINAFFREGFGLDTALRGKAETVRFTPDDRADGIRWDNRLNWSTEDLPGTQDGDSVDLGGNRVLFGAETVTIDDFVFGDFGQLKATSGRLNIEGEISTGKTGNLLQIDNAGQVWIDGYRDSDLLRIDMAGGRLANIGNFAGETAITVAEDAQFLLATSGARFDLASSNFSITGSKAKVGFDGSDGQTATLHLHDDAVLSFVADQTGLGQISEFRSGAFGTPNVTSGVRLDGELVIDLSVMDGKAAGTWTLIDADQMIGSFDDISITGLGKNRDALVRIDYVKDEVVLLVSEADKGSGQVRTSATGDADFVNYTEDAVLKTLWEDLHSAMPQITDDPI